MAHPAGLTKEKIINEERTDKGEEYAGFLTSH
jgi:hypothetical protein